MTLRDFNDKWTSPAYPPHPVSEQELRLAEQRLGVEFPSDYRNAVLQVGLPRPTIALLDAIVERELVLAPLGDFYAPNEIVEETLGWREIGMPEELVAIASDGMGNMFCFDSEGLKRGTADGQAVWFFDHDFDTTQVIAPRASDEKSESLGIPLAGDL
jgi:cell wall assembly regulator SMI1